jgi:hypothetical protein
MIARTGILQLEKVVVLGLRDGIKSSKCALLDETDLGPERPQIPGVLYMLCVLAMEEGM